MIRYTIEYIPNQKRPIEILFHVQENQASAKYIQTIEITHLSIDISDLCLSIEDSQHLEQIVAMLRQAWIMKKAQDKLGWGVRE